MIRTLCTLAPSTKADGTRCLRGELSRALTTTAADGRTRTYPAGTGVRLVKNANGSYSLLALLPDDGLAAEIALTTDREREIAVPF